MALSRLKGGWDFECGKVGLVAWMKHARVPIWNIRVVRPLRLRRTVTVGAYAGLKHFNILSFATAHAEDGDAETGWRVLAFCKPIRVVLDKQKKLYCST
jgi:hypothetical protein